MSYSLQRRLSVSLALAVLVCGVFSTLAAFYSAYLEAQEFQDDALHQIAAFDAVPGTGKEKANTDQNSPEDSDSRIQLLHLPNDPRPSWLPANISPGLHTISMPSGEERLRVFVRRTITGGLIVVAQSTEIRNEIAFNSAFRTLAPMLVLLPALIVLAVIIVRRAFKPLNKISERLNHQTAVQIVRIPDNELPEEVVSFVQAINRLLERIEKAISAQRRFIADAAHELRTPLAALSLQAQNLAQADSPLQMRERLVPLQAGLDRTCKLTVQLLDFARLQVSEPTLVEVDALKLARELIAEFLPLAESRNIDLGLEDAGLRKMLSDPHLLSMIIRNSLENAIKYAPYGGIVTLRLVSEEAVARIDVIDNGPGIPPQELGRAFEAFHRIAVAGEGSGLGLAIAHEAAATLGGSISIQNRLDTHGLVFSYTQLRMQTNQKEQVEA